MIIVMITRIATRQTVLDIGRTCVRRVIEGGGLDDVDGGDVRKVRLSRLYLRDQQLAETWFMYETHVMALRRLPE